MHQKRVLKNEVFIPYISLTQTWKLNYALGWRFELGKSTLLNQHLMEEFFQVKAHLDVISCLIRWFFVFLLVQTFCHLHNFVQLYVVVELFSDPQQSTSTMSLSFPSIKNSETQTQQDLTSLEIEAREIRVLLSAFNHCHAFVSLLYNPITNFALSKL